MTFANLSEKELKKLVEDARIEMEQLSSQLKDLILKQPPRDLIAYIWSRVLTAQEFEEVKSDEAPSKGADIADAQFLLEYIHAALACFASDEKELKFDPVTYKAITTVADQLRGAVFRYCMMSTVRTPEGAFGPETAQVEFLTKTNWVLIRGHRHQVLEKEFFDFVLAPHNDILKKVYEITASEVAAQIQAIADTMRTGHMSALDAVQTQIDHVARLAEQRGITFEDALRAWSQENPEAIEIARSSFNDIFRADIGNLSKHTKLPLPLLDDLAFARGENTSFFAPGPFAGTPLRTLPARTKPLIKLDDEYFAIDPSFVRDTAYRAILWNLLRRQPDYRPTFDERQKEMGETAFAKILSHQLSDAEVYREVWYKDPITKQWVESDTLILLEDILITVEAKSGSHATVASPAADFDRHSRAVQDLIGKAHTQCRRLLEYVSSADEVPLYRRDKGKYVEFKRIRLKDYRAIYPIGLTVESFAPFSAMCKELPNLGLILGRYSFISISIDDLFVLNRFLPTAGEFFHYLTVRQCVGGIQQAHIFDEMDHLGAYIAKNRFDMTLQDQLKEGADRLLWSGFSEKVDGYFEGLEWDSKPIPKQDQHPEIENLLIAINATPEPGRLCADNHIRDYGEAGRKNLGDMLRSLRESLNIHKKRWFQFGETSPLFLWLQRAIEPVDLEEIKKKATASAISIGATQTLVLLALVQPDGGYSRVIRISVTIPPKGSVEYEAFRAESSSIAKRRIIFNDKAR